MAPPIDPRRADRAAIALGIGLGALILSRAALSLAPGMSAWGFNAARFVPLAGWTLSALAALALVPGLARPIASRLERSGDALARRTFPEAGLFVAITVALVVVLPDRMWMVGDFLLRLGCSRGELPVDLVFPQALPLDVMLHHHVAVMLQSMGLVDPNTWERLLGALEAAIIAGLAVGLARELGLRGTPLIAAIVTVTWTGLLGMFTGYGKGFVELTMLTVAAGFLALRVAREGRGAWWLALVIVTGLAVHRSAITLLVLPPVAASLGWPVIRTRTALARASTLVALGTPYFVAGRFSSVLIAAMKVTDATHLAPTGTSPGAILGAAFAPGHLLEVVNVAAQATPLVLLAPIVAPALGGALGSRRREWSVLLALMVPAALLLLFVHPRQGLFRDYDVFAPSLAALSLGVALLLGDVLRGAPARAWLSLALVFGTLGPTLDHLLLQNQIGPGMRRAESYLNGPPSRPANERALLWAFVAERKLSLDLKDEAVAAFAKAAELAPSPRILFEWALAEEDRQDWAAARDVYLKLLARSPGVTDAWIGVANTSLSLGDRAGARRAAERARELEPSSPAANRILNLIERGDSLDVAR